MYAPFIDFLLHSCHVVTVKLHSHKALIHAFYEMERERESGDNLIHHIKKFINKREKNHVCRQ